MYVCVCVCAIQGKKSKCYNELGWIISNDCSSLDDGSLEPKCYSVYFLLFALTCFSIFFILPDSFPSFTSISIYLIQYIYIYIYNTLYLSFYIYIYIYILYIYIYIYDTYVYAIYMPHIYAIGCMGCSESGQYLW